MKKSGIGNGKHLRSEVETRDREGVTEKSGLRGTRRTYRLSIFEDLSDEEKPLRKQSLI